MISVEFQEKESERRESSWFKNLNGIYDYLQHSSSSSPDLYILPYYSSIPALSPAFIYFFSPPPLISPLPLLSLLSFPFTSCLSDVFSYESLQKLLTEAVDVDEIGDLANGRDLSLGDNRLCVCVWMCVCVRERMREKDGVSEWVSKRINDISFRKKRDSIKSKEAETKRQRDVRTFALFGPIPRRLRSAFTSPHANTPTTLSFSLSFSSSPLSSTSPFSLSDNFFSLFSPTLPLDLRCVSSPDVSGLENSFDLTSHWIWSSGS